MNILGRVVQTNQVSNLSLCVFLGVVYGQMNMPDGVEQTNRVANVFPALFFLYAALYRHES